MLPLMQMVAGRVRFQAEAAPICAGQVAVKEYFHVKGWRVSASQLELSSLTAVFELNLTFHPAKVFVRSGSNVKLNF